MGVRLNSVVVTRFFGPDQVRYIRNYTGDFYDFRICYASRQDLRCVNKFRKSRNK